jgi:hypothetical protein
VHRSVLRPTVEELEKPQAAYDNAGDLAPAAPMEAPAAEMERSFASPETVQSGQAASDRIVIKNAREELVVDAPDKSMEAIGRMAEEMGGFVVAANMYQSYLQNGQEVPRASITVRVPAERLNEALARIEAESDQPSQQDHRQPGCDRRVHRSAVPTAQPGCRRSATSRDHG